MLRLKLSIFFLLFVAAIPVFSGDIVGQVNNADGTSVNGATIAITDQNEKTVLTETDKQGHFSYRELPTGKYFVTASTLDSGTALNRDVEVPVSGAVELATLTLGAQNISISGHISASNGPLPSDIKLYAVDLNSDVNYKYYARISNGYYRVSLAPGTFGIVAGTSKWIGKSGIIQIPGNTTEINLKIFPKDGSNPKLAEEILNMVKEDQDIRHKLIDQPQDAELLTRETVMAKRFIDRVDQIFKEEGGWPSADLVGIDASQQIWVLMQHASMDELKKYLPQIKQATNRGELSLDSLALTEDRILVFVDGKKQLYGTQFYQDEKDHEWKPYPIEDEEHLDERRAAMGMDSFAAYKSLMKEIYTPHATN